MLLFLNFGLLGLLVLMKQVCNPGGDKKPAPRKAHHPCISSSRKIEFLARRRIVCMCFCEFKRLANIWVSFLRHGFGMIILGIRDQRQRPERHTSMRRQRLKLRLTEKVKHFHFEFSNSFQVHSGVSGNSFVASGLCTFLCTGTDCI